MFGWVQKITIAVRPIMQAIVKVAGVAICSQLCYYLTTRPADGDGWVETPTEELASATLSSRYQVERTRQRLVELGLLEETRRYGNKIWSRPTGKSVQIVRYTIVYQLGNGRTRTIVKFRAFPEHFTAQEIEAAIPQATSIVVIGKYSLIDLYKLHNPIIQDTTPPAPPKPDPLPSSSAPSKHQTLPPPPTPPKPETLPPSSASPKLQPLPSPPAPSKPEPTYYSIHQHPCERVDDRFNNRGVIPEWKKSRSPQDYTEEAIECVMAYLSGFSKEKGQDPALRKRAISHLYRLEKESRFGEIKEILTTYKFNRFSSRLPEQYREAYPYYLIQRRINAGEIDNFHPDFVKFMSAPNAVHDTLKRAKLELERLYKELNGQNSAL